MSVSSSSAWHPASPEPALTGAHVARAPLPCSEPALPGAPGGDFTLFPKVPEKSASYSAQSFI